MAVLSAQESLAVRALREAIHRGLGDARLLEDTVLPELQRLCRSEHSAYYQLGFDGPAVLVERLEGRGLSRAATEGLTKVIESNPVRWGQFHALNPELGQRNKALTRPHFERLSSGGGDSPAMEAWVTRTGLRAFDQCRVLLCDDDRLMAWVGAARHEPFQTREQVILQSIVPALQGWFLQRARLADSAINAALLGTLLEAVTAPAFVLSPQGTIRSANGAGQAALVLDQTLEPRLKATQRSGDCSAGLTMSRLVEAGLPAYALAVLASPPGDPAPRVAAAKARLKLTPREAMVLELLAGGLSNKSIALALKCATGTVEVHVRRVLEKANADSRSALIADFWRRPL